MTAGSTFPRPSAAPAGRGDPTSAPPQFTGKYLSLTTVKRDGTGVATPVWFVAEAGTTFVVTGADSHKVRRIRRNPAVTVAECTAGGRPRSSPVPARAHILPDHQAPRARPLMARKYRLDRIVILPVYRAVQTIRHGRCHQTESVVLVITPAHDGSQAIVEALLTEYRGGPVKIACTRTCHRRSQMLISLSGARVCGS
jgi:PPOX class probable F420-dependent enzyme